mmetsp:Transcript_37308/g.68553  ORF Transcript_37308/g.68553 Transcript_37308/m.68553 type:complete len:245 (+) Transcript_37308:180-914(+)
MPPFTNNDSLSMDTEIESIEDSFVTPPQNGLGPRPISRRTAKLRSFTSSQRVRSKFFQKLGIGAPCRLNQKSQNVSVSERSVRDLRYMPRFNEPLQYNHYEERVREEQRQSRQSSSASTDDNKLSSTVSGTSTQKRQVNFQETVTVVPIPMRSEYSVRIRARLFSDSVETSENLERNLVEFTAENGDWRSVCLEDEMFLCGVTRELIHPVHVETEQYVFGSAEGFQPSSLSQERQRYWNDQDAI